MAGNDREPIGRKGKPSRPVKQKVSRRRQHDDDYDDDYEDEEPMPRKGKGKGRKPRGKRGWLWLLLKLFIVLWCCSPFTASIWIKNPQPYRWQGLAASGGGIWSDGEP